MQKIGAVQQHLFLGNLGAKLKFRAPVISSHENLQLFIKITLGNLQCLSEKCNFLHRLLC